MIGKKKIDSIYNNKKKNESILKELKTSIETFNLEKRDFISIIDGMLMDVKKKIPGKRFVNRWFNFFTNLNL